MVNNHTVFALPLFMKKEVQDLKKGWSGQTTFFLVKVLNIKHRFNIYI